MEFCAFPDSMIKCSTFILVNSWFHFLKWDWLKFGFKPVMWGANSSNHTSYTFGFDLLDNLWANFIRVYLYGFFMVWWCQWAAKHHLFWCKRWCEGSRSTNWYFFPPTERKVINHWKLGWSNLFRTAILICFLLFFQWAKWVDLQESLSYHTLPYWSVWRAWTFLKDVL